MPCLHKKRPNGLSGLPGPKLPLSTPALNSECEADGFCNVSIQPYRASIGVKSNGLNLDGISSRWSHQIHLNEPPLLTYGLHSQSLLNLAGRHPISVPNMTLVQRTTTLGFINANKQKLRAGLRALLTLSPSQYWPIGGSGAAVNMVNYNCFPITDNSGNILDFTNSTTPSSITESPADLDVLCLALLNGGSLCSFPEPSVTCLIVRKLDVRQCVAISSGRDGRKTVVSSMQLRSKRIQNPVLSDAHQLANSDIG
ncbi:uncharacterized protein LOC121405384 [Drosophila obscura]|uniref:uncharacterized protein LOC121405384 n=1 Tax=Drosophila obscura TaxID=7282 RepID=UPI001BB1C898|nr:uncharacterized protein LOC121405384 [Drosophila obscura]